MMKCNDLVTKLKTYTYRECIYFMNKQKLAQGDKNGDMYKPVRQSCIFSL